MLWDWKLLASLLAHNTESTSALRPRYYHTGTKYFRDILKENFADLKEREPQIIFPKAIALGRTCWGEKEKMQNTPQVLPVKMQHMSLPSLSVK